MCLYPTLIKNRKYVANKKNGGLIPPIPDERVKWVAIGCQQCIECRKQKAREWQIRLQEDLKHNANAKFITLTFSNECILKLKEQIDKKMSVDDDGKLTETPLEGYELDNEIATQAVRYFLERWRKKYKKSLRHWLVTELGHEGTENIHLHGIVWTDNLDEVERIWQYGYVWKGKKHYNEIINYVNEKTVNYIVKYVNKIDEKHKEYKSKILTSPGIGNGYMKRSDWIKNVYKGTETKTTYRTKSGHDMAMPIYFRNKVYSEKERELLWIHLLDKQERWVCGERVDISENDDEYWKLLEYHRKRNKTLGYGDGVKDWSRSQYEKERRQMMMSKRLEAAKKNIQKKTVFSKIGEINYLEVVLKRDKR